LSKVSQKEKTRVVFSDNFFMTDEACTQIERFGKVINANCDSEDEMVRILQTSKPKVIATEYFEISERIMDSSPNLKAIVIWGVGYDHVDVEAASKRGIYVVNTKGSNAESVAEHVFSFMLTLSRKTLKSDTFVRNGEWISREETGIPKKLAAQDLYGKTIGIIGLGTIGSRVARIALGFKMHVLAYDPYLSIDAAKEKNAELVSLEKLLSESDFVTIHVVLNEKTRGMISSKELSLMKPNAYLINASRGQVIVEKDLVKALKENKLAGAGLDVFEKEPISTDNPILEFDNVIVSPHSAGNSEDALVATSKSLSQEIIRILKGETPRNLVNKLQLDRKDF
jgi:D-3-phosphoglycerate dehydrogenase